MNKVKLEISCAWCNSTHHIIVYVEDYKKYVDGMHVQDAFPYLSLEDRELLISHTCSSCWDKMMGTEE